MTLKIELHLLRSLAEAPTSWDDWPSCLPGTRRDLLAEIGSWIEGLSTPKRVFWLHGAAGTGKSTIAHHIAVHLHRADRLVAWFFFSRNNRERDTPELVIGTLVNNMARFDSSVRDEICKIIDRPTSRLDASSLFKDLFVQPLLALRDYPDPVVLVFDAIDEYHDGINFLDAIVENFRNLPQNVRIFITSRPEFKIQDRMDALDAHGRDLPRASDDEIRSLIRKQLQEVRRRTSDWPPEDKLQKLVELANGHFIWAKTACNFIVNTRGHTAHALLDKVVSPGWHVRSIYDLYTAALSQVFPPDDGDELALESFQIVMGAIVVTRRPLSLEVLAILLEDGEIDVRDTVLELGCVLSGSESDSIQIIHTSFSDFLADNASSGRFHVNRQTANCRFGAACARYILRYSKSLETDFETWLSTVSQTRHIMEVSSALQYACVHWVIHIDESELACIGLDMGSMDSSQYRESLVDLSHALLTNHTRLFIALFHQQNEKAYLGEAILILSVLKFPIVRMEEAARVLLNIWDSLQLINVSQSLVIFALRHLFPCFPSCLILVTPKN